MSYQVEQNGDVLTVRMDQVYEGWEQWFLLASDVHWDNPHCRRDLWKRHLDQAKERGAGVFVFGDFFCAMQGKYDPRGNKASIRPEHNVVNYLDALVDTAAEDLQPYQQNLVMITPGNHETAILKRLETDITTRLTTALGVHRGGYSGYVRFLFSRGTSNKSNRSLFYHHGYGGGGPVTKGVIQTNRRAVYLPDAQLIVTGHVHESFSLTIPRLRLSPSGQTYQDEQEHIQLGTYKDEFTLEGGYHVESGRPPKPLGGAWIRFAYDTHQRGNVGYEIIRAR